MNDELAECLSNTTIFLRSLLKDSAVTISEPFRSVLERQADRNCDALVTWRAEQERRYG